MYLKSLELHGFKSFPDKTKLTFERGSTVIVGPNGSGKSNISDAMRWVLGEISPKSLRGSNKEIIFSGADSRRPMGFAEVSVTFDNTDPNNRLDYPSDEVVVTRRYYSAGESEYMINRQACLLRDIYKLFMNTGVGRDGYSIIGQGKIQEIISRKSDERRSIFEDASGIAKYRKEKTEAERKLQATDENMARVNDIFQEVAGQVGPLERAAEKAKKALELYEQKKKADVQLWIYDSEYLRQEILRAEENYRNSAYELELAEEAIANYRAQSEQLAEQSLGNRARSSELHERIQALTKENSERDGQYRVTETNIAYAKEKIEAGNRDIAVKGARLTEENGETARRRTALSEFEASLAALDAAHTDKAELAQALANRAMEMGGDLATAQNDINMRNTEAMDIKVRIQVIEKGKVTDSDKQTTMEEEIAVYRATSERLARQWQEKQREVEDYAVRIAEAERVIAECDAGLSSYNEQLESLRAKERDCTMQADLAGQRITAYRAMAENYEGAGHSVRHLMESYAAGRVTDRNGRRCGKIYGPLSNLITVDREHVSAIEAALAANLQHIVVEDDTVMKAVSHYMKETRAGRVTLFPISAMRTQTPTAEMEEAKSCTGYVGVASDLVNCEEKFRGIVGSLLGRTVVFDDLENANEMAKRTRFRVKVVTLDGQVINAGGSAVVGSMKQKGGALSRASEIEELTKQQAELNATLEALRTERVEMEGKIADLAADRTDADERRQLLAAMQGAEATTAAQYRAQLDSNDSLLEKLNADFEALGRQRAGYDEELEALAEREQELRRQIAEIEAARGNIDVERNEVLEQKATVEKEMGELVMEMNNVRKDIEVATNYLNESLERARALEEEIEALRVGVAEQEERIRTELLRQEANRNTFAEGERVLEDLKRQQTDLSESDLALEKRRGELDERERRKTDEKEKLVIAHSKNESKLFRLREDQDKLTARFNEDYDGMTRNQALELGYELLDATTAAEARQALVSIRARLSQLGNVDLDAVEKYKEVKERYDKMLVQIEDLTAAREDSISIIKQLEATMQASFMATFEKINTNFDKTFKELFGGGSAELTLTDPTDVLTSGIDIKAAPPGKIVKSMTLLSGGEQSFIAIALLFAILQVNPTPFFILDEIEAALDEVNVARFAAYIKRYSTDTQFILITHRRGTMEAANRLYGVTMPERGISKVLALDVSSIRGKGEGDDWDGIFS